MNISKMTSLLLDRTIGMLMNAPRVHGPMQHEDDVEFVTVLGGVIDAPNPQHQWVLLTRGEFLDMFGPEQKTRRLQ